MLRAARSRHAALDINYNFQSAGRASFPNNSTFLRKNVSIRNKVKLFDAITTPIPCFGAGPFQRDPMRGGGSSAICWRDSTKFWTSGITVCGKWSKHLTKKYGAENCACQHWKHWKFGGYNMNIFFLAPL